MNQYLLKILSYRDIDDCLRNKKKFQGLADKSVPGSRSLIFRLFSKVCRTRFGQSRALFNKHDNFILQ